MNIKIFRDSIELGNAAGTDAAQLIRDAIEVKGSATIIMATGTSQFQTINKLIAEKGIDWSKVTMFHLDEYIGLPAPHPASFRKYLQERFITKLPGLTHYYLINGEVEAEKECERLGELISGKLVDVALVGIGENGHLAFNDPPADFETDQPYILVDLDEACRNQQLGEGWFASLDEVPRQAISMSVKQIVKSKHIICSVPESRKAIAVKNTLEQRVSNLCPASILQSHPACSFYLDQSSAALLSSQSNA